VGPDSYREASGEVTEVLNYYMFTMTLTYNVAFQRQPVLLNSEQDVQECDATAVQ